MHGLMMDYQLTIDRILEHGNQTYPHKTVITKQPDGSIHPIRYDDLYKRVKRLAHALVNYQIPTINEVPKTSVGKFNKRALRRHYAEGELSTC